MWENSSRRRVASASSSAPSRTIVASTSPQLSSMGSSRPPTTWPIGSMLLPIELRLQDLDDATVAIDFQHCPIGDAARRPGDADDGGDPQLPRHDYGMAHLGADIDDHRLGGHEQRCPR